jgi:hypothetical protein
MHSLVSEVHPMVDDDTFVLCFLCGGPALWVIEVAGEDEPLREEAACEVHARGHWRRALLTSPPEELARSRDEHERTRTEAQRVSARTASK